MHEKNAFYQAETLWSMWLSASTSWVESANKGMEELEEELRGMSLSSITMAV